ncbi:MAG: MFS transporter [Verrucomicrobiota bacterium]
MPESPFAVRNVRLFLAFRVLFNARFYYPIFTVLFLDFGLTLEQFLLLNGVWAVSIVLLEVPSGALADVVGRRQLVVYAGALMVVEMALLAFAPINGGVWLLIVMLLNRVLSGAAEAAASGADEALAYDSLDARGLADQWPRVLQRMMQLQSAGFVVALLLGAFLYDASALEATLAAVGFQADIGKELSMRLPLFLGLGTAVLTLLVALRMRNIPTEDERHAASERGLARLRRSIADSSRTILQAARWIGRTPAALMLIVAGFLFDSVIRTFVTMTSEYYRVIGLPEAAFGVVGATTAALGVLVPIAGRWLAEHRSPVFNFWLLFGLTLGALFGIAQTWEWWGLIPVVPIFMLMSLLGFFLSFYLNRLSDKRQRATVLSFRSLAFNLAYGLASAGYALLTGVLRDDLATRSPELGADALQRGVFVEALGWLPWIFLTMAALYILAALWQAHHSRFIQKIDEIRSKNIKPAPPSNG